MNHVPNLADLRTAYWAAPIPTRECDWSASIDGREEYATGWGATREAAIENLLEVTVVRIWTWGDAPCE